MVPKPREKYFLILDRHQCIVQPCSTQRLGDLHQGPSQATREASTEHPSAPELLLAHQASPYPCWAGMALGLSEHRNQLSVPP